MADSPYADKFVLIVDDVEVVRNSATAILSRHGFANANSASSGAEVIELFKLGGKAPDCIISDFNMPEINGLQLLKTLRTGGATVPRGLPFALLTGYAERPLVRLAVQLDADAFLAKPVEPEAFVRHVTQLLEHGPRNESELHPVEHYASIDVDTPVGHIILDQLEPPQAEDSRRDRPRPRIGPPAVHPGHLTNRIQDPLTGSRVAKILAEEMVFVGQEMLLADVPDGVRLARDLHYIGGRRLLRSGERLSERTISRLRSLRDIGEISDSIWVVSADLPSD